MLTANELELRSTLTLGTLESNAEVLRDLVQAKLQDYSPEFYVGRVAEAKADRAVLNNASKMLNSRRLELEREYMAPFEKFKATIKETCTAMQEASCKLDEIVKTEENREKEEKRGQIQSYWDNTGFTLCTLDKVFDQKWLNKGAKLKDIKAEIDAVQKRTLDDLKVIENFPAEDVALIKAVYLDTLSITDAMNRAELLKANRDRLAREKAERKALETKAALDRQETEEHAEMKEEEHHQAIKGLVEAAAEIESDEPTKETFALVLTGTRERLLTVRRCMTSVGVTYIKLAAKGNGVYTEVNQ